MKEKWSMVVAAALWFVLYGCGAAALWFVLYGCGIETIASQNTKPANPPITNHQAAIGNPQQAAPTGAGTATLQQSPAPPPAGNNGESGVGSRESKPDAPVVLDDTFIRAYRGYALASWALQNLKAAIGQITLPLSINELETMQRENLGEMTAWMAKNKVTAQWTFDWSGKRFVPPKK
ncbi:MAG: hypothetical protein WB780_20395 [Candidatus Acidiferrales bacterium]